MNGLRLILKTLFWIFIIVTVIALFIVGMRIFHYHSHGLKHDLLWKALLSLTKDPSLIIRRGFYGLWFWTWLIFWEKWNRFVDSEFPDKVFRVSIFIAFLVAAANFSTTHYKHWFFLPVIYFVQTCFWHLAATLAPYTYPFILSGFFLLEILSYLGFERVDPIQAQLKKRFDWSRKKDSSHDRYVRKALKKGLTYIGYEVERKEPVFISEEDRNNHIQIVGSTGSGKTRYILFPMIRQDIIAGRGVVIIDAKGSSSNAKTIFKMAQEAGREGDFVPFLMNDVAHSATYNPLLRGNPSQLKDKIAASIEWSEPYYQRVCESALQSLFMDLERLEKRATLKTLHSILRKPPRQLTDFYEFSQKHKDDIGSLFTEIDLLVNTPFGRLFDEQNAELDLMDIYRNKKIAYFALDTQSYQQTAVRLGKMITQDLNTLSGIIHSQFSRKELQPLPVYIDEFQAFGTKGFVGTLARGRESGLWITLAHQSIGDLKAIDEAFAQQIIDSTSTKVFLRVNDPDTAQLICDSVGTSKVVETTSQVHIQGTEPAKIMGSQKVVHEYRIHPTEVKNLNTGQAVYKARRSAGRLTLRGCFMDVEGVELPERKNQKPGVHDESGDSTNFKSTDA